MSTIYDVIDAPSQATRWEEQKQALEPYMLEAFFPVENIIGTELSYLQGNTPVPRVLDLSAYDVKALPVERGTFEKITTELPFWKNKLDINEKMRQELLKVLATGNQRYIDVVLNKIFDDNATLLKGARATREMMRAQLMTTGAITFASNGQSISYDFGVTAKKTISDASKKWNTATADPINDIIEWQDEVEAKTGVRPTNLLMNRKTFNYLKKVDSIKNAIYVFANGTVNPNDSKLAEYILSETGCVVYVYDKGYFAQGSKEMTKFVPDNVVTLFPDGELGKFVYGTTPEEADLMSGATDAVVSIVDGGVALTTSKEKDPVTVTTKVSMTAVPTLEVPKQLAIAVVA